MTLTRLAVWLARSFSLLQQRPHVSPELRERLLFVGRELLQGCPVPAAGEVAVLLPVPHDELHIGTVTGSAALQPLLPRDQVSAEPVERLLAEAGLFLVVELTRVLALAGGGQRGVAGGVVA